MQFMMLSSWNELMTQFILSSLAKGFLVHFTNKDAQIQEAQILHPKFPWVWAIFPQVLIISSAAKKNICTNFWNGYPQYLTKC